MVHMVRANRLGTDGGAVCNFGSVIVRVVSRRWFGQAIIWVGDIVWFRGVDMGKNSAC